MKKINIDLLPLSEKQIKRKKIEFIFFASKVLCLIVLSIVSLDYFIFYQVKKMESHRDELAAQVTSFLPTIKKLVQLKKQSDALNSALELSCTNHRRMQKILVALAEFELLVPLGILIKTIEYNSEYLVIAGLLPSETAYMQLIKKLKEKNHLNFKSAYCLKKKSNIAFILKVII